MGCEQGLRQTMNHPIYKMQQDFLRRHEHVMEDELRKMLEGEELLSMQERTAVAATLRFDNNGEHQGFNTVNLLLAMTLVSNTSRHIKEPYLNDFNKVFGLFEPPSPFLPPYLTFGPGPWYANPRNLHLPCKRHPSIVPTPNSLACLFLP